MAILFGTTADGQSLPVQVNEFGQLVAQGLPGPQGEQGEQGEPGPVGDVAFTNGMFEPVFSSSNETGAGFLEYEKQIGYWYRFGPLVTIQFMLRTSMVGLTDIRGYLEVTGLPPEAYIARPTQAAHYGPFSIAAFKTAKRGSAIGGRLAYNGERNALVPWGYWNGVLDRALWADLENDGSVDNTLTGTFSGLAADAVRSVPISLDDLM